MGLAIYENNLLLKKSLVKLQYLSIIRYRSSDFLEYLAKSKDCRIIGVGFM
ncbi:hypothetical protein DSUL_20458 [Desulfovibrionales bacterium]